MRRISRLFVATKAIILCCVVAAAEPTWISLGGPSGSPPEVSVVLEQEGETVLDIGIPGFWLADTVINETTYSWVVLPGEACIEKFEYPAVPKVSRSIIIPDAALMALEATEDETEEMTIPPVLPSRGIIMRSEDPDTIPFRFSKLYEDGGLFPASAGGLGQPYIFRDFRGIAVHAHPFSHNPRTGRLLIRKRMTVRAYQVGIDTVNVKLTPRSGRADPTMIAAYKSHFINYAAGGSRYELLEETGPMLVIAGDGFSQAPGSPLRRFVDWKQRRGYPVHLFTSSQAGGQWGQIWQFIYEKWNPANPGIPDLCFVVLVGDGAWEPGPFCVAAPWDDVTEDPPVNHPADNRYVYLDGTDHYADLLLSRFPAGNEDELDRQVSGLIQYERNPLQQPDPTWLSSTMATASWMVDGPPCNDPGGPHHCNDDPDWIWAHGTMNDFGDYYITHDIGDPLLDEYYYVGTEPTCPVTAEGIAMRINEGRSWLTVIGHGQAYCWWFKDINYAGNSFTIFSASDLDLLANHGMLPFVFSVTCEVANWDQPNAVLAKGWLCAGTAADPAGAVGFLGATTGISWTPPLFALQEAVKVMLGVSPNAPQAGTIGAIYFAGLAHMLDQFTWLETYWQAYHRNIYLHTPQCWVIHGDCSMQVRTLPPEELVVTHPMHVGRSFLQGGIDVPFDIVSGVGPEDQVSASLVKTEGGADVLLGATLCDGPGSYSIHIPQEECGDDGTLYLTVSGLNKLPYEGSMTFTQTYPGAQSGVHTVHGTFSLPQDLDVDGYLHLEKYQSQVVNVPATFYIMGGVSIDISSGETFEGVDLTLTKIPPGGKWGGFDLMGNGTHITLTGCTIEHADYGIFAEGAPVGDPGHLLVQDCEFLHCQGIIAGAAVYLSSGRYAATVEGTTFSDCPYHAIRLENSGEMTWLEVRADGYDRCEFSGCGKGIEYTGPGALQVYDADFYETTGLDMGIVLRDITEEGGPVGTISGCTFTSTNGSGYHAIECRTMIPNQPPPSVWILNNTFQGPSFDCGATSVNSCAVFIQHPSTNNRPEMRDNAIGSFEHGFWHGVRVLSGSLVDLGTPYEPGHNQFWDNCCHIEFTSKQSQAPGIVWAWGDCWNGDEDPGENAFCGVWAGYVSAEDGWCPGSGKVPVLIPTTYALRVEGPNPFAEVVRIALDLPEQPFGDGRVEIVDMAGRVVKDFRVEDPHAATYRFTWDGRGEAGSTVPNGVYVCRARVAGRTLTARLVRLKPEHEPE